MKFNTNAPSERSSLLPKNFDDIEENDYIDFPSMKRSFSQDFADSSGMRRTTHNDPTLHQYSKDMSKLHGSTQILYNQMLSRTEEKQSTKSLNSIEEVPIPKSPIMRMRQSLVSTVYKHQEPAANFLDKIKTNFFEDAKSLTAGTIPQSVVVAVVIGIVCGIACWIYYTVLYFMLEFLWNELPEIIVKDNWPVEKHWLWVPIVSGTMVTLVGLSVKYLGEPGDLPYTVSRVHHFAYIPIDHVMPMVFASMFSILAGGSLGPEAPLVAICGAIGGFVSRTIFRQRYVDVVRKHTLMGMAGALAAFFGAPLGGSLFALEVNSRFGIEYFEHLVESIFCGEITLMVFRSLSGLAIKPIWDLTSEDSPRLVEIQPWMVFIGGIIGLMGAFMAYLFATFHWANMRLFASLNLLDNSRAVYRGLLGCVFIVILGVLCPYTMFWGEEEFEVVATLEEAKKLPYVWPTTGISSISLTDMDTPGKAFLVGIAKLIAISFTVAGGLRGGYIFPLMCAGAAFGRFVDHFFPDIVPVQVSVLCMAAGINVAITRTALASTLILAFLPGEPCAIPAILMASLSSLFATAYVPFIKTQITRSDIDHSLFHENTIINPERTLSDDEE